MKTAPHLEITKHEILDYLNDRMGTKCDFMEKNMKLQRSPPPSTKPNRIVMTSPKERQLKSIFKE